MNAQVNAQTTEQPIFNRLALIGFGLIGGSIARAARAQGLLDMDWDDTVGDYRLHIAD